MDIRDVTYDMLPLYTVENRNDRGGWSIFTTEPFRTKEEAERHIVRMKEALGFIEEDRLRVGTYTVKDWRDQLFKAVKDDPDCIDRALSILRNETLVDLLK